MPNWKEVVALNNEIENRDDGSERQDWKCRWWLWTPKLKSDDGSKRQNREVMMALNAKLKIVMMALNVELKIDDGSERQTEKRWWLWTPKLKTDDEGSERQTENSDDGSERRTENTVMALNAET